MNRDEKLLASVKAVIELERLGFERVSCLNCNGAGVISTQIPSGSYACFECDGSGYVWREPPQWCKPVGKSPAEPDKTSVK